MIWHHESDGAHITAVGHQHDLPEQFRHQHLALADVFHPLGIGRRTGQNRSAHDGHRTVAFRPHAHLIFKVEPDAGVEVVPLRTHVTQVETRVLGRRAPVQVGIRRHVAAVVARVAVVGEAGALVFGHFGVFGEVVRARQVAQGLAQRQFVEHPIRHLVVRIVRHDISLMLNHLRRVSEVKLRPQVTFGNEVGQCHTLRPFLELFFGCFLGQWLSLAPRFLVLFGFFLGR